MIGEVCKVLGHCFNLKLLDLSGNKYIGDDGILNLQKGEKILQIDPVLIGLKHIKHLKLNGLDSIGDQSLIKLCTVCAPCISELELNKCENLSDFGIDNLLKKMKFLKRIHINGITQLKIEHIEDWRLNFPNIEIIK
jgi:hypothetical protein